MTIKDPSGKLARWSIFLQAYEFEIIHRPGKKHTNADCLSRPWNVIETLALELEEVGSLKRESSSRDIDHWEDEPLLHYLETGKFKPGASQKQCKRILEKSKNLVLSNGMLTYHENEQKTGKIKEIPKRPLRGPVLFSMA